MFKKLTLVVLVLCCLTPIALAQEMVVFPYGMSPREVAAQPLIDRAFNGLSNVGVGTQMYLVGQFQDSTLTAPTWTVTGPEGSAATITVSVPYDASTRVSMFIPDVVGTYVVDFTDGEYTASLTINAGTYVGMADGGCHFCHADEVADWEATGHADMLVRGLDGTASSHYGEGCISCHTVGFDTLANNAGFDDREFVFPDSLFVGQYDNMVAQYGDAMKLANIQCESCHGPASAHNGDVTDSKMVSSLDAANCAWCHDSGTHHVFPAQWRTAGHANPPARDSWSGSCARCHAGTGFVQYAKGETVESTPPNSITCAVCHDPHSNANEHQLRTVDATPLGNGHVITEGGTGKLCMNCHMSRREANSYTEKPGRHFGPHYGVQADMLAGTNVVTFGVQLPSSPHLQATTNSCVDCHMYGDHLVDDEGNVVTVGGHSFNMTNEEGEENVHACEPCHGDVGESFAEKKFFVSGNADHDGDGEAEGLQEEVHGLMDILGSLLPDADTHADVDTTWTKTELKAAYNHRVLYYDHSYGVHNPAFTVALLKVSIQALLNNAIDGRIVAIEDVPNDQGKKVRIIWEKFVDDGIAVDPVATYLVKRLDGETWVGVGQYPAHGAPRYALVVPTVWDATPGDTVKTAFKVVAITKGGMVHQSLPGEGFSVDNLVPHAPPGLMAGAVLGNVELTWEPAPDPDVNYYKVFRSDNAAFIPDETTEIGTTIDMAFVDAQPGIGTWYYKVLAVDFSGNIGEATPAVNASITSVDGQSAKPTKFDLSQNYPNPFNPETSIRFSLLKSGHVTLDIYNSRGQRVNTIVDKDMSAGEYSINFLADGLTSGVYVYRIKVNSSEGVAFQAMKKMILMK
ncbi:T9SS type A sorting domain-containing protein [candidate division KSB1 bacterium]|nr:T9SS type A sorting domain-containing protein [candidate division KSB1 bacterium]MBL7093703.1 T9SS type A sorting domain-containing protein [candidate division KSB1 bacterium]